VELDTKYVPKRLTLLVTNTLTMAQPAKPKLPDAYSDLGVSPDASSSEIKAAYKRLALLHHPDKQALGEVVDAAEFRQAQDAWDMLKTEDDKRRYDQGYARVQAQWVAYRQEFDEFTQSPEAWRGKQQRAQADARARQQAQAQAAAAQRRQAQEQARYEYYNDSDSDDDYYYYGSSGYSGGYSGGYGSGFGFGGSYRNTREEDEWDAWLQERLRQQRAETEARWRREAEERALRAAKETANQRCIDKLKAVAEAEQAKGDGIRTIVPEQKRDMAKTWVQSLQVAYAKALDDLGSRQYTTDTIELGWDKKKGRQTCHFCEAHVHEYSFRCPSGGAIACRGCKNKIAASSLKQPFLYENTGAGAKKWKGKKGRAKKAKTPKTKEENQSDSEDSDSAEEGAGEDLPDEEEARRQAAEEAERKQKAPEQKQAQKQAEAARKAELQAQKKLQREAAERAAQEKAVQEKAEAEKAAREKAAADKTARETAALKKAAREQEAREKEAQKKAARKKAAKERAALGRAAQEKVTVEKEAREREAQKARETAEPEVKELVEREARELAEREARERAGQGAREREEREAKERAERVAKEKSEREAKEKAEREAWEAVRLEQEARKVKEQQAREAKERQVQEAKERKAQENKERKLKAAKERKVREKKARQATEDQQARDAQAQQAQEKVSASTPNESSMPANGPAVPKKSWKKGPVCFYCDEQDHLARNCPTKHATLSADTSQPPTSAIDEPAPVVEAATAPSPPAKLVVKLPALQKAAPVANGVPTGHSNSVNGPQDASTAAIEKTNRSRKALRKQGPRPAPVKTEPSTSDVNTAIPVPGTLPVNSSQAVPMTQAPRMKASRPAPPQLAPSTNGVTTEPPTFTNPVATNDVQDTPKPEKPNMPTRPEKNKVPRPALQKTAPSTATAPSATTTTTPVSGTENAPVPDKPAKAPRKKAPKKPAGPLVCFNCNEEGHIQRKCPARVKGSTAAKVETAE
jgi:curved DNA-binding protein CbpA